MIKVQGLQFGYSKKSEPVLRDISFSLNQGETLVLLGPNGAGKSTLIATLLSELKPWVGSIQIDGKPIEALSRKEKATLIAYVPQSVSHAPSTVFDAVMLGRLPYFAFGPSKEDEEIVWATLEEVGLTDFAARNVMELSGGEKQRVAIARALAQDAKILLFDEPTSNLDIGAEALTAELVGRLVKSKGKTAVLAMHDLNLAHDLGDRFLLIHKGGQASFGGKEQLVDAALSTLFGVEVRKVSLEGHEYFIYGGNKQ